MMRPSPRLRVVVLALLCSAAGCQPQMSPAPSGVTPTPAVPTPGESRSRPAAEADLFGTAYAPTDGFDGGQVVIGDSLEPALFNPFYINQQSEANVASAVWSGLVVVTHDYRYAPDLALDIPTLGNGGVVVPGKGDDAMTVTWRLKADLRWSDGAPLTCDDFRYAWEWIRDPANGGVVTSGWDDITDWQCPSATEMVLHFRAIYE